MSWNADRREWATSCLRSDTSRWWESCAIVALFAFGSCYESPLCDPELKLDTTYVVTAGEIYGPQSTAQYDARYIQSASAAWSSCSGIDGLIPGALMSVRTTEAFRRTGSCKTMEGVVLALPNGERWQEDPIGSLAGGFANYNVFTAIGQVVSGPCQGTYKVSFGRPDEQISLFSPTDPGKIPSMLLGRSFDGAGTGANCKLCYDVFVAQLALAKQ